MTTTQLYEELKPAEMEALVSATPLAYLPSGTLEWHSAHLPFGLDALKAYELCKRAAAQSGGVVVPPTYWAIGGMPHPWTMRLEMDLVERLFTAIYEQLGHAYREEQNYSAAISTYQDMAKLGPEAQKRGQMLLIDGGMSAWQQPATPK